MTALRNRVTGLCIAVMLMSIQTPTASIRSIAWSQNNKVAVNYSGGLIVVYNEKQQTETTHLLRFQGTSYIAWQPGTTNNKLLIANPYGEVEFWDVDNNTSINFPSPKYGGIADVAWNFDGTAAAAITNDDSLVKQYSVAVWSTSGQLTSYP